MAALRVDDVVLLPSGALLHPATGELVLADVHVGYGETARAAGASLPATDAAAPALRAIEEAAEALSFQDVTKQGPARVERILVNGDAKHGFGPLLVQSRALRAFDDALRAHAEVVYVRGNHDRGIESILPRASVVDEARVGGYTVAHGDRRPNGPRPWILGHEHPVVHLRDEIGSRVRARAFLRLEGSWVLPAISAWAAGVDVLSVGAFAGEALAAEDPGECEVYVCGEGEVLHFGPAARLPGRSARRRG